MEEQKEMEVVTNMAKWIEDVGKPALESQNALLTKLHRKDGQWKSALAELERLKDINLQLQETMLNRPSNEQHMQEKQRGDRLTAKIEDLEQNLWHKEQVLYSVTRHIEKMRKKRKRLECDREDLTDRLSKMSEEYNRELDRTARRNKSLKMTVLEKEKEIAELVDAMKRMGKNHQDR